MSTFTLNANYFQSFSFKRVYIIRFDYSGWGKLDGKNQIMWGKWFLLMRFLSTLRLSSDFGHDLH